MVPFRFNTVAAEIARTAALSKVPVVPVFLMLPDALLAVQFSTIHNIAVVRSVIGTLSAMSYAIEFNLRFDPTASRVYDEVLERCQAVFRNISSVRAMQTTGNPCAIVGPSSCLPVPDFNAAVPAVGVLLRWFARSINGNAPISPAYTTYSKLVFPNECLS
jgi:hypothetical protein